MAIAPRPPIVLFFSVKKKMSSYRAASESYAVTRAANDFGLLLKYIANDDERRFLPLVQTYVKNMIASSSMRASVRYYFRSIFRSLALTTAWNAWRTRSLEDVAQFVRSVGREQTWANVPTPFTLLVRLAEMGKKSNLAWTVASDFVHKLTTISPQLVCLHNLVILCMYAKATKSKLFATLIDPGGVLFRRRDGLVEVVTRNVTSWLHPILTLRKNASLAHLLPMYNAAFRRLRNDDDVTLPFPNYFINNDEIQNVLDAYTYERFTATGYQLRIRSRKKMIRNKK